ncbi:V4R domain-containing protein [Desulfosporosinus youngiae]|uniref:Putative hydrocarbon binding protein (Contains V4R domain) n=1 Tax=Desulfosporosinus youngiae DSM 17734 TaxID=768710 RepID=H5Y138_9FIRM|nr:V4R domain-containing protein [Desulfosporosinus youngiae]EHQ87258.1 putative hydrocarbon binding protein (contains V4R domain) [Desulfosporosinus youngiae DSM 17734]
MKSPFRSFKWKDIGDIERGRPAMGEKMHVAVYRMFHYSLRGVLEKSYGKEAVKHILVEAGRAAGKEFCRHELNPKLPPQDFFHLLKQKMAVLGIGLLEVEHADFENMIFILTVSEDLDCSGLPETGETVCNYDEGLIMGILEQYTGKQFIVRETDCWSTGDWTCRFHVVAI